MAGLISDPARQAHHTFRGYVYQILRSIAVWLELGDDEQLFLEGAEDLDRIDGPEALTEQVKDTIGSGNITLRTGSVIDAINNFWTHRARNPDVAIRFRYLTTSGIGVEQGAPFGSGRGGLQIWNSLRGGTAASADSEQVAALATFLLAEGSLSAPVASFFENANPSEMLSRFITPIEWLAGQQDGDALIRQIKDRLVIYGASVTVAPADAELAFDALYTAAFDAAKKKDSFPLTRAQFLRIFAGSTGVHVPKQDLMALVRAAASPAGGALAVPAQSMILEGPPPLPNQYFHRVGAERALEAGIAKGAVLLHGSTGSGKTLNAASTLTGRDPLWLTLRDLNPAEVKSRLLAAADLLAAEGRARILVIDDLDGLSDPRLIEAPLGTLWNRIQTLGGHLIITSDRPLPDRLAQAVHLDFTREQLMQPFDVSEIEAFLLENVCPQERADVWSKLLEVSTMGHPQLVSARVRALSASGFREPQMSDMLGTEGDVDRVKFEARRLIAELPDNARELLLRASLMTGRLTRQRLLSIGRMQDAVVEPGVAIDVIAGPWLEMTDDGAFRVSPLARGSAEQLRGQDWIKATHGQLAWIYLTDRTISPWDISSILMHCYIAGTCGPLVYVSQGMFSASEETWRAVGEACGFYAALGLDEGNPLPFKNPLDVYVFRILQYRIAAETNPDTAMRIALQIEKDFAAAPDDDPRRFFRFLYLSQFLSILKVRYPIGVVVARAIEFFDVARELETTFPDRLTKAGLTAEDSLPTGSYAQFAAVRLFAHIQDIVEFTALIEALRLRADEDARALLDSIGVPDDMSSVLIERLWLTQHASKNGKWTEFRDQLRAAYDFSVQVGATAMARAIAPVLLRTINEDMEDPLGAAAEATRLGVTVQDDPIYLCALAKVTSDSGDYPKAKLLWQDALPQWPKAEDDIGAAFAHRMAAIAAGRNKEWAVAATYFDTAKRMIKRGERPTFTLGLAMDGAFARFMAGECAEAVSEFGGILAALEPMQADYESEPLLSLQRRSGGVLSALSGWHEGKRPVEELTKLVGMCSNLDPFETKGSVAPPLDTLRIDYISLELAYGASLDGSLREAPKLRASPFMSFRATSGTLLFTLAQRTLDFSDIVADGLAQLDALAILAEQMASGDKDVMRRVDGANRAWSPGSDELLVGNMVAAAFALAAANQIDRLPLDRWRADATAHPQGGRVVKLVDHLEALFVNGTINAWATVLKAATIDWSHHASSSLAATLLERLGPDALLVTHGLWVHYLRQPHLAPLVANYVDYLAVRQWRARVAMPGLFVPEPQSFAPLREALDDKEIGWPKFRRVLQAALSIVPLAVDDNARITIEAMSD